MKYKVVRGGNKVKRNTALKIFWRFLLPTFWSPKSKIRECNWCFAKLVTKLFGILG